MRTPSITAIGLALLIGCSQKPEASSSASTGGGQTPDSIASAAPAPGPPATVVPPDTGRIPPPAQAAPIPKAPNVTPAPKPPAGSKPAPPQPVATATQSAAAPPPAGPYYPAPRDTLDNDTYQGWKQFELNCSRCHGEYGVGTSFVPALVASLKPDGPIPTKEVFVTVVCAGRLDKGMPSWCALGLEMGKIEQIYLYVKARADGKIAAGRPALRQ